MQKVLSLHSCMTIRKSVKPQWVIQLGQRIMVFLTRHGKGGKRIPNKIMLQA